MIVKECGASILRQMPRKKLKHFGEMKTWTHVLEPDLPGRFDLKTANTCQGTWGEKVILELGCGRGTYTVALAERLPEAHLVGVDLKGARLWHGGKTAMELGLSNVTFLRSHIQALPAFFAPEEVDEIWITFPDPHPTEGNERRRLTSPRFLELYSPLLKKGGRVHLKTDNEALFRYSVQSFEGMGFEQELIHWDLHKEAPEDSMLRRVRTQYEEIYLKKGQPIFFVSVKKP